MNDGKQLVAIRVTRPYSSEDEFLEHEIEALTRTSVMLIGAQSRPQGVILRFEVAMLNGTPLMRGEGRVIGFKPNALGDLPGLTLRFTRLDRKTKELVDRAAAIRDARARAAFEASMGESEPPPSLPPLSMGPASLAEPLSAPMSSPVSSLPAPSEPRPPSAPPATPPAPPPRVPSTTASYPSVVFAASTSSSPAMSPASHPPNASLAALPSAPGSSSRDALLDRLRQRGQGLSATTVSRILDQARHLKKAHL